MKNLKKVLALVLAVVMIMGVVTVASAKTYKDADAEAFKNYADAIDALSSLNILDGFEDGEFKADRTFNRAQAAKIVAIVHNAATNGKIKGQDAISALYSNAQNPFVDCNNSWALPYINYCRITGLADGMTATTYAPKRELTGVQWLKLMLTTLNFDTAKEGYTGTGWDVNVLNRANEVGLTAGLADDWKAIAPIKRGEAAQILYNALTKYLVEYGQLVKNNYVNSTTAKDGYYKSSFISNEQVAQSGYTLGGKMGVTIKRATDKFRRPGYTWSYGAWSAFYMDAPIAEYKEAVSACTILKNDMGISETSGKSVTLNGGKDAAGKQTWKKSISYIANGKVTTDDEFSVLNYFAVDGRKFNGQMVNDNGSYNAITLTHDKNKNCQSTKGEWHLNRFGGQGDLTQVFETEDGYVITVIHTFLAEVTKVNTTNRRTGHTTGETSNLKVWLELAKENAKVGDGYVYATPETLAATVSTTAYTEGSKVLVNVSLKDGELADKTYYGANGTLRAAASVVSAAEAKVGALTGASDLHYPTTVSIDGTQYNANCRFVLGRDDAMSFDNYKKAYTFYFDSYGNVIGCGANTTASQYVVMDKIYSTHDKGTFAIKADLYTLTGDKLEDVTVSAKAGSFAGTTEGPSVNAYFPTNKFIDALAKNNDADLTDALYTYTVDDKGVYTLTWVGVYADANADLDGFSRYDSATRGIAFEHRAGRASIMGANWNQDGVVVNLTSETKIICKGVDGKWKSYTGYKELPALTAQYVDYIAEKADSTFASVLYLGEVSYAGDEVIGFVTTWDAFNWANGYDVITVYVNGEPVKMNLQHKRQGSSVEAGVYKFKTAVDEDGVTYVVAEELVNCTIHGEEAVVERCINGSAIVVKYNSTSAALTPAIALDDVKVYLVDGDTVTAIEGSEIEAGDAVVVYGDHANDTIIAIYVIKK